MSKPLFIAIVMTAMVGCVQAEDDEVEVGVADARCTSGCYANGLTYLPTAANWSTYLAHSGAPSDLACGAYSPDAMECEWSPTQSYDFNRFQYKFRLITNSANQFVRCEYTTNMQPIGTGWRSKFVGNTNPAHGPVTCFQ